MHFIPIILAVALTGGCIHGIRPDCGETKKAIDTAVDGIAVSHQRGEINESTAIGMLAMQAIAYRRASLRGGPCE